MATATEPAAGAEPLPGAKPPFIRRVRIRNYKSIAFCDVTLEPLTVLVGRNGSGKSNFLDALAFLRDVVDQGLGAALHRHGRSVVKCRWAGPDQVMSFEITCGYEVSTDDWWETVYRIDVLFMLSEPTTISREEFAGLRCRSPHGPVAMGGYATSTAAGDAQQERVDLTPHILAMRGYPLPEPDYWFRSILGSDPHRAVVAFRNRLAGLAAHNFSTHTIRVPRVGQPGGLLEWDGANLASVLRATQKADPASVDRIRDYLVAITQTVDLIGPAEISGYETLRFRVAGHPTAEYEPWLGEFDAASVSDGSLRALCALVAAFQVVPPHGSPSLIGIEEPETALHPAAANALVGALDEATLRTQVLVTTHSADLLDHPAVRPENVRVVRMVDGRTVIGRVDEASVEIVKDGLNTLGGLERDDRLDIDHDDLARQLRPAGGPAGGPA